jgi:hypothetical protein
VCWAPTRPGATSSLRERASIQPPTPAAPHRLRRAWRQRSTRARGFTNAGVVCPGAHQRLGITDRVCDRHGAGAPTWPRPAWFSLRRGTRPEKSAASGGELAPCGSSMGRMSGRGHSRTCPGRGWAGGLSADDDPATSRLPVRADVGGVGLGDAGGERGIAHQWAFVASIFTATALVLSAPSSRARLAAAIYAVRVVALFVSSPLYHRVRWRSPGARRWMRRLDHSMICGDRRTYMPFALIALRGALGGAFDRGVGGRRAAGVVLTLGVDRRAGVAGRAAVRATGGGSGPSRFRARSQRWARGWRRWSHHRPLPRVLPRQRWRRR